MKIRATDQEIDISDDLLGLNVIERIISDFLLEDGKPELIIYADKHADPAPYTRTLQGLIIRKGEGPTLLKESDGYVVAIGSVENLDAFCSSFSFTQESRAGDHTHFDYFEGNIYIHPDSRSAVVSLRGQKPNKPVDRTAYSR